MSQFGFQKNKDDSGDLIDPNFQGGRLESGSDAHVRRFFKMLRNKIQNLQLLI